jgi:hypothetical protein
MEQQDDSENEAEHTRKAKERRKRPRLGGFADAASGAPVGGPGMQAAFASSLGASVMMPPEMLGNSLGASVMMPGNSLGASVMVPPDMLGNSLGASLMMPPEMLGHSLGASVMMPPEMLGNSLGASVLLPPGRSLPSTAMLPTAGAKKTVVSPVQRDRSL